MEILEEFSYRKSDHNWLKQIVKSIKKIPEDIFFEEDGSPLKREVDQLDKKLFKLLLENFGAEVENNSTTMAPENLFSIDIVLPTKPATLIEIEKGRLPRLELDFMKILNTIHRYPSEYGFGCIIAPANYIKLNLAGKKSPCQYVINNLIPLNSPIMDLKDKNDNFMLKDFFVIGYCDPRGS